MNKIASIYYVMELGLPTLDINIITRKYLERDVLSAYTKRDPKQALEWVIRSGEKPDKSRNLETGMPWTRNIFSIEQMIKKIKEFYLRLDDEHLVFIHPQREFVKSGNMRITEEIVMEGLIDWPEPLSHGRVSPEVIYYFKAPWYLKGQPYKSEGKKDLFNKADFIELDRIENRLRYSSSSFFQPTVIEFSFNKKGKVSIHDISC